MYLFHPGSGVGGTWGLYRSLQTSGGIRRLGPLASKELFCFNIGLKLNPKVLFRFLLKHTMALPSLMPPWPVGPRLWLGGWPVSLFCCAGEEGLYLVWSSHGRLREGCSCILGRLLSLASGQTCPLGLAVLPDSSLTPNSLPLLLDLELVCLHVVVDA